ncbi:hypothetical protein Y032_0929g3083 [Ancylostoma ceylanicum]|nr:hypothetical protein Y032_0929g3083 [Ancylostoma ceylanicum]
MGAGVGPSPVIYNSATPAELHIPSFGNGKRVQLVLIPLPGASRFHVNLRTGSDIALHFNPRFDENAVVCNSTSNGGWLNEERAEMPFRTERVYTLEFVANYGQIQVLLNGAPLTSFSERLPSSEIHSVEIGGDVHVHSAHIH